jgi:hypothetical protein
VQSDIQEAILHPGNVRINVQGAFIVDEEQPGTPRSEDYEHDPKDIRLPNHTAVVSHIALDVSVTQRGRVLLGEKHATTCRNPPSHPHQQTRQEAYQVPCGRLADHLRNSYTSRANLATMPSVAA